MVGCITSNKPFDIARCKSGIFTSAGWEPIAGLLGLGLGLEAKFSGLGLETSGLGLGLVFLALALFKAKVKVTNILPNTVYLGIITLTVHWYTRG